METLRVGDELFYLVLGGAGVSDKVFKFFERDGETWIHSNLGVFRPLKSVLDGTCKDLFTTKEAMRKYANPIYNKI